MDQGRIGSLRILLRASHIRCHFFPSIIGEFEGGGAAKSTRTMGNKLMDSHQLAHFCHVNHSNRNGEATRKSQPDMSLLTLFEKSLKKSHFTTFSALILKVFEKAEEVLKI